MCLGNCIGLLGSVFWPFGCHGGALELNENLSLLILLSLRGSHLRPFENFQETEYLFGGHIPSVVSIVGHVFT